MSTTLGMTARVMVAAAVLVVSACGGNGGTGAETPPGSQPAPVAAAPAEAGRAGAEEEEPLTGEVKRRAEQAALASFPGTVLKSEYDVERPGMLAVEIQQASGETVEVYLDQNYTVVDTKDEGQDGDDSGQGDSGQGDGT